KSASPAVSSTPPAGQARSRFSPSSSSTGGTRRSMGSGPHASTPAFTPPASHPSHDRVAHAPTRNTRALSPTALDPNGPASAAARLSASSAVSSTARVQTLSSLERWVAPCASTRSEEHTSELQSLAYLVCRPRLEKKNPDP